MTIRRVQRNLVIDANVLIDYARTDKTILALAGAAIGPVLVPEIVLAEVDDLTAMSASLSG